jgi:outer membrane protein
VSSPPTASEHSTPASRKRSPRARLAAVASAVVLAFAAPRLYAQMRVAVVDMQRALLETDQGRHAKNQLKTLFQRRQEELNHRQDGLKQQRDELERQQRTLSRAEMETRMRDYQRQFVQLQQDYLEYQQELARREAELTKTIYVNLQAVIRQIGAAEGMTAIFEQGGVVWSPQHLDVTDRVVQSYNQQYPVHEEADAGAAHTTTGGDAGASAPHGDAGHHPVVNPHPREESHPSNE